MSIARKVLMTSGGKKDPTYVEDVFSTYLYDGNQTARTITNGVDLSEGGLVWIKGRTGSWGNNVFDTARGTGKILRTSTNAGQSQASFTVNAFNSNGFGLGNDSMTNASNIPMSSWSFKKQKGFFDVLTYTGDGTKRDIAHNLGCVPGAIFVKRIDASHNWGVYHRGLNEGVTPEKYRQRLNIAGQEDGNNANGYSYWADTAPTSTHFTVSDGTSGGQGTNTNVSGATYVAYLFAGGESTAANARSVALDSSNGVLSLASSSDFAYGTGDFTWECWAKSESNAGQRVLISNGSDYGYIGIYSDNNRTSVQYVGKGTGPHIQSDRLSIAKNQWFHVAVSRNSGVSRLFLNGLSCNAPAADTGNYPAGIVEIGKTSIPGADWDGLISNVRIVKGTGLYTTSFTPPTEPLTNITNTVLLCCNDSSPTGSTVSPGTITNTGSVTASTDSPFDDPAAYKFGEGGDQDIIKCGSFKTDNTNGAYLDLPWEPQWFLYKQNNANNNWIVLDNMRGWSADGYVEMIYPNTSTAASVGGGYEELLGRTIKFQGYGDNYDFMYIAIRRPDGLVGKPVEDPTKVFNITTGTGVATIPSYVSGFPVDMGMYRAITSASDWWTSARLMTTKEFKANATSAASNWNSGTFDSNNGWAKSGAGSGQYSWMWKRHAGFDVVPYIGTDQNNRQIKHNLGRVPEMIWTKSRTQTEGWPVWHKDLTTNNFLKLNLGDTEGYNNAMYEGNPAVLPTSIMYQVGSSDWINKRDEEYISFLFASVEGICKVGSYTGTEATQTITTGFQPRFLIIKEASPGAGPWYVLDTTRGWAAGDDAYINLNETTAQSTYEFGAPTATGFTITTTAGTINELGEKMLYYAHA